MPVLILLALTLLRPAELLQSPFTRASIGIEASLGRSSRCGPISALAKKKAGKKQAAAAPKGFGAPPPPPPPPLPKPARRDSAELVPVDLGKGKQVTVMLPAQVGEPTEAKLQKLQKPGNAVLQSGVLSAYGHLKGAGDVVWPAGIALARLLAHVPSFTSGQRVLELGCGLGAAGIAAATAGASSVLLTDRDAALLEFAQQGAAASDVSAAVSTAALDWAADEEALLQAVGTEPFDVIIGADLLYDAKASPVLAALLGRLMPPGPPRVQRCVLSDPQQGECRDAFAAACAALGLEVDDSPLPGPEGARMLTVARLE